MSGYDPGCVKTHTSEKCRKDNSPVRHRTSRVQYDLTLRDAIARKYFYMWRDRWSFRTAKTQSGHWTTVHPCQYNWPHLSSANRSLREECYGDEQPPVFAGIANHCHIRQSTSGLLAIRQWHFRRAELQGHCRTRALVRHRAAL